MASKGSMGSLVHPVPYHSQWASPDLVREIIAGRLSAAEDPRWAEYGAATPEEYEWWAKRLCGVACLRMALDFWRDRSPSPMALAGECLDAGAYIRRDGGLHGLIHAPFADYVRRRWELPAEARAQLPASELPSLIAAGRLAMLSVHRGIRILDPNPERRGGHLVLAVGSTPDHLVLHNPSGFPDHSQRFARVPWTDLDRFYAGHDIILGCQG